MREQWIEIEGFGGNYSISSSGRIRSNIKHTWNGKCVCTRKERIMKQSLLPTGYWGINLCFNGQKNRRLVHRLIANGFIPNPLSLPTVNHIDGVKANNNLSNLEWSSRSDQNRHAIKLGLKKNYGENHSQHKLKETQVVEIRRRISNGDKIKGSEYGVSDMTIKDVMRRKSWTHL